MMRILPVARVLTVVALVAAVAQGCAKKVTSVDSSYTQVEGHPDAAVHLVMWPDVPVTLTDYVHEAIPETSPVEFRDIIRATNSYYTVAPGANRLAIFDGSAASAFQMFRREPGGGYRQFLSYPVSSSRRWLDTHYEYYGAADQAQSGYAPPTYVARGLVEGLATTQSPLSNVAATTVQPLPTIQYKGLAQPADSLFRMTWTRVDGAAGYWLHVYQFRPNATTLERQLAGAPNPILGGNVQDFFVGYVSAPDTTFKLPPDLNHQQPGQVILTRRGTLNGQVYFVRVTAVDAAGQVVGWMPGDRDSIRIEDPNVYRRWQIGAVRVNPKRPTGP